MGNFAKFLRGIYKDEMRVKVRSPFVRDETEYYFCYDEKDCKSGKWNVFMFDRKG